MRTVYIITGLIISLLILVGGVFILFRILEYEIDLLGDICDKISEKITTYIHNKNKGKG